MGLGAYYAFFGQDEIAFGKCIFAHVYVFYMQQVSDKPSSQQQHNNKKKPAHSCMMSREVQSPLCAHNCEILFVAVHAYHAICTGH